MQVSEIGVCCIPTPSSKGIYGSSQGLYRDRERWTGRSSAQMTAEVSVVEVLCVCGSNTNCVVQSKVDNTSFKPNSNQRFNVKLTRSY